MKNVKDEASGILRESHSGSSPVFQMNPKVKETLRERRESEKWTSE